MLLIRATILLFLSSGSCQIYFFSLRVIYINRNPISNLTKSKNRYFFIPVFPPSVPIDQVPQVSHIVPVAILIPLPTTVILWIWLIPTTRPVKNDPRIGASHAYEQHGCRPDRGHKYAYNFFNHFSSERQYSFIQSGVPHSSTNGLLSHIFLSPISSKDLVFLAPWRVISHRLSYVVSYIYTYRQLAFACNL